MYSYGIYDLYMFVYITDKQTWYKNLSLLKYIKLLKHEVCANLWCNEKLILLWRTFSN